MKEYLTMSIVFDRLREADFKEIRMNQEEFCDFTMLIQREDFLKLSFKKPVWHDIPIVITKE